jgi:hypothetical protein
MKWRCKHIRPGSPVDRNCPIQQNYQISCANSHIVMLNEVKHLIPDLPLRSEPAAKARKE